MTKSPPASPQSGPASRGRGAMSYQPPGQNTPLSRAPARVEVGSGYDFPLQRARMNPHFPHPEIEDDGDRSLPWTWPEGARMTVVASPLAHSTPSAPSSAGHTPYPFPRLHQGQRMLLEDVSFGGEDTTTTGRSALLPSSRVSTESSFSKFSNMVR